MRSYYHQKLVGKNTGSTAIVGGGICRVLEINKYAAEIEYVDDGLVLGICLDPDCDCQGSWLIYEPEVRE